MYLQHQPYLSCQNYLKVPQFLSSVHTALPLTLQPCEVVVKMTSKQWLVILQVHIEHIPLRGNLPSTYPSCLSGASGVNLLRLLILILFLVTFRLLCLRVSHMMEIKHHKSTHYITLTTHASPLWFITSNLYKILHVPRFGGWSDRPHLIQCPLAKRLFLWFNTLDWVGDYCLLILVPF